MESPTFQYFPLNYHSGKPASQPVNPRNKRVPESPPNHPGDGSAYEDPHQDTSYRTDVK